MHICLVIVGRNLLTGEVNRETDRAGRSGGWWAVGLVGSCISRQLG